MREHLRAVSRACSDFVYSCPHAHAFLRRWWYHMRLIRALVGRLRPVEVYDEYFGRLIYMKVRADSISYWEAKRIFEPTGREIELFIDAPAPLAPPNIDQRRFYEDVALRYRSILLSTESLLRPEIERWTHGPMINPFDREFTVSSFSIPVPSESVPQWEMSFDSITVPNELFSVTFRGSNPQSVAIGG
jgi:hypothetical protein